MHTTQYACETLDLLWQNYSTLRDNVDTEAMSQEALLERANDSSRELNLAAWLAHQGFFISAWCLWERYTRNLCESLPDKSKKMPKESVVRWVGRSFARNGRSFANEEWFESANNIRNLIAHSGCRDDGSEKAAKQLRKARKQFPDLKTCADGYLLLDHGHAETLWKKVYHFFHECDPDNAEL